MTFSPRGLADMLEATGVAVPASEVKFADALRYWLASATGVENRQAAPPSGSGVTHSSDVWLIWRDGEVVGGLQMLHGWEPGSTMLANLMIRGDVRKSGAGRELVLAAVRADQQPVITTVETDNTAALGFFTAIGFRQREQVALPSNSPPYVTLEWPNARH
jgi:ribosomal protein S18 acetylase RimI-like enzyme